MNCSKCGMKHESSACPKYGRIMTLGECAEAEGHSTLRQQLELLTQNIAELNYQKINDDIRIADLHKQLAEKIDTINKLTVGMGKEIWVQAVRAEKAEAENAELRDRLKGIEEVYNDLKNLVPREGLFDTPLEEDMWQAIKKAVEGK
jgi:SMC interacting uncharacterized protein involved in chromosome segregation